MLERGGSGAGKPSITSCWPAADRTVHTFILWDSLHCMYPLGFTNFKSTSALWLCLLPSMQPILQAQLLCLYLFTRSPVISWWLQIPASSLTTHSVSVRCSKKNLLTFGFRMWTPEVMFQLDWLTPGFVLGTVWYFTVLFAYDATLVLCFVTFWVYSLAHGV
jgi:hypothetical protein